jgi:hypothetical protein
MAKQRTDEPLNAANDVFAVLEKLAGSVEAPVDWSAEHDHYLYGTPKRSHDTALGCGESR